jgi:hypothetical protein
MYLVTGPCFELGFTKTVLRTIYCVIPSRSVFRGNTRVLRKDVAFREPVVNGNSLYKVWPGSRFLDKLRREALLRMWLEKRLRPPDVGLPTASFLRKAHFCTTPLRRVV